MTLLDKQVSNRVFSAARAVMCDAWKRFAKVEANYARERSKNAQEFIECCDKYVGLHCGRFNEITAEAFALARAVGVTVDSGVEYLMWTEDSHRRLHSISNTAKTVEELRKSVSVETEAWATIRASEAVDTIFTRTTGICVRQET